MCLDSDYPSFAPSCANMLLHPFLEDAVRVEEKSVLSSKAASDCDRISVMPEYGSTILLSLGMTGGPLCGRCSFHWDCCFVNYGPLVTWWLYFGWFRAGPHQSVSFFRVGGIRSGRSLFARGLLDVRIFFPRRMRAASSAKRIAQIKYLRGVLILNLC